MTAQTIQREYRLPDDLAGGGDSTELGLLEATDEFESVSMGASLSIHRMCSFLRLPKEILSSTPFGIVAIQDLSGALLARL